jgi:hypothetical protein
MGSLIAMMGFKALYFENRLFYRNVIHDIRNGGDGIDIQFAEGVQV